MGRAPEPGRPTLEGCWLAASAVKPSKRIFKKFIHNQYGLWQDGCCRKWESEQEQLAYLLRLVGAGLREALHGVCWEPLGLSSRPSLPCSAWVWTNPLSSQMPRKQSSVSVCVCVREHACTARTRTHTHHCLGNPHIWLSRDRAMPRKPQLGGPGGQGRVRSV